MGEHWPMQYWTRIIMWHSQMQYLYWAIYKRWTEDMQLPQRESENHHERPNVSFPLKVTPGLQLKHRAKLCDPVPYEINHLEMSDRTHNGLSNNLLNKTQKKDINPHNNYHTAHFFTVSQKCRSWLNELIKNECTSNCLFLPFPGGVGVLCKDREPIIPAGGPEDIFLC